MYTWLRWLGSGHEAEKGHVNLVSGDQQISVPVEQSL